HTFFVMHTGRPPQPPALAAPVSGVVAGIVVQLFVLALGANVCEPQLEEAHHLTTPPTSRSDTTAPRSRSRPRTARPRPVSIRSPRRSTLRPMAHQPEGASLC